MKTRKIAIVIVMSLLAATSISFASVTIYNPNIPYSQQRVNGPVGREFTVYCQSSDTWGVLGFKQYSAKKMREAKRKE